MKKFRKIWTNELNNYLLATKGMAPGEAYAMFLRDHPDIKDVTRTAFCNQRSRVGAAGKCTNLGFARKPRPLYSEQIKKGYVRIKIAQPNVWVMKSKWVYMETHPEEYEEIKNEKRANYIFLDGNNRNFSPGNIARVPSNLMGVFCSFGETEKGHPEISRLRLAQAKLKTTILDRMEDMGKVKRYKSYRVDPETEKKWYLKRIADPDYKTKRSAYAKEYMHKMKLERPEKYAEILKKNRERRKKT